MQTKQHLCGRVVKVQAWKSHGETILEVSEPKSGQTLYTCPECGEEFFENTLFPMDIFPTIAAEEMAILMTKEA